MKKYSHKHFPMRIQVWIRVSVNFRLLVKWIIILVMVKCSASVDIWVGVDAYVLCRYHKKSGQALFTPLKLRSEGLVPASAARGADADFLFYLPRRRDSPPSCPLRFPEARETLQGPRTPAHKAPAQKNPARPATAYSGSCANLVIWA